MAGVLQTAYFCPGYRTLNKKIKNPPLGPPSLNNPSPLLSPQKQKNKGYIGYIGNLGYKEKPMFKESCI